MNNIYQVTVVLTVQDTSIDKVIKDVRNLLEQSGRLVDYVTVQDFGEEEALTS